MSPATQQQVGYTPNARIAVYHIPDKRRGSEAIWSRVSKPNGDEECWPWVGALRPDGYGFLLVNGRLERAHRLVYELVKGKIPDGLILDHLCRNPRCVNPAHLEAVTRRENTLRGIGPAAIHATQTECLKGHPFDEANTYIRPDGSGRNCKACQRQRNRETLARKRNQR